MKYLLNLDVPPEVTNSRLFLPGDSVLVQDEEFRIRASDDASNDAGFGWLWCYNPRTNIYKYKISMFDGRTVPAETEIPYVGVNNYTAYNMLQFQLLKEHSVELSFKALWNALKGLVNGLLAKF